MNLQEWQESIETIAKDRRSGAQEIAKDCVATFENYAEELSASRSLVSMSADLQAAADRLLSGQPSMAPVLRICNDVLLAIEDAPTGEEAVGRLQTVTADLSNRIAVSRKRLTEEFLKVTADMPTFVTLSYSSAIATGLKAAGSDGIRLNVTVLESRPQMEGRRLATVAANAGHQVKFAIDSAAYAVLQETDGWITGADALLVDGVVNKIGTAPLAAAATQMGKKGFVIADSMKIWPAVIGFPPFARFAVDQVWKEHTDRIKVENDLFERTPWAMITGVIFDHGPIDISQIEEQARALPMAKSTLRHFV